MRIGLFGGTFNPPHIGHLILAQECLFQLQLDRVDWVLTPDPPHKGEGGILPAKDRIDLVSAAIDGVEGFALSRVDIDREPPHYALDTVRILKDQQPQAEFIYLMGGDSLRDLPGWHKPMEFVAATDGFGVMRRPGDRVQLEALLDILPGLAGKISFVEAPLLQISASEIRRRIANKEPFRFYLPGAVYNLIVQRGYYCQSS